MENKYWRPYKRSEEFHEEDVWNVIKEDRKIGSTVDVPTFPGSISRRLPSAAQMIPETCKQEHDEGDEIKLVQQHSAPVSVPDWSKIYGKSFSRKDDSSSSSPHDHNCRDHNYDDDEESDADEEDWDGNDGDDRLPPHEWLAKKFARSQISSFSVCEGAGRKLKGRDLSRVRNAVLSKTGFI